MISFHVQEGENLLQWKQMVNTGYETLEDHESLISLGIH